MIYVLKVKPVMLATVVQKSLRAEDLDLEYKNMTLKDMRTLRHPIVDHGELTPRRAPARTSPRRHSCRSSPSAPRAQFGAAQFFLRDRAHQRTSAP